MRILKISTINILLLVALVAAFDTVVFNLVSGDRLSMLTEYRRTKPPKAAGRFVYPRNYFIRHDERGFDIGKNRSGFHWVDGVTYPIWSNSLGCFDKEPAAETPYVYFAGDSFTWGYTPYEQKFATIIEKSENIKIFKCGVAHSGQLHQYSKMKEIIGIWGKFPESVFVFYTSNDMANDHAFPHSTVLHGWQVDDVFLDEGDRAVRLTEKQLGRKLKRSSEKFNKYKDYE